MTPHSIGNRAALGWLLCLSLLLIASPASATDRATPVRQYVRNTWDMGTNLPNAWVDAIVQTEDGFIWVGTQQGLGRFDGTLFTTFDKTSTKDGIKHNYIRALLEDKREKTLWIGTFGGGLARYTAGEFRSYSEEDGLPGK